MVRNTVVVGAVVLVGLLAGETEAAFRNPDGVAVIIGNRAYKYDVPQVTYAHRDAAAFRRYVIDMLGFDPENVIHEKNADKATLERVFGNKDNVKGSDLWRYLHPDGLSDVVVFYSGHGIPGLNDKRGYLLPVNAHPDAAELNGYPIDVLYDNLVKLKEQQAVRSVQVFLDACFSGDSGGGRLIGSTSAIRVAPRTESMGVEKLTILTAASGKEVVSWDKTAKHGLFTHHLLNALYGAGDIDANGQVTVGEAKAYLDRHMTRAARRTFGRVQNADFRGEETAVLARAVGGMFPVRPAIGQERQVNQRGPHLESDEALREGELRNQFYRDYYETYRQKFSDSDIPYERFLELADRRVQQDPRFLDDMSRELQRDYGTEPATPCLSPRFKQDYYDAFQDKFADIPMDRFNQLVDDRLLQDPRFAMKMGDELYRFVAHKMSREEFDAQYLPQGEDWTGPMDVLKEGWQTQQRNGKEAIADFDDVISPNPQDAQFYRARGFAKSKLGSGCTDTSVTDSSGRSLKDIADQWGYDPEEAYAFGLKIQDAVRKRDLTAFFSLVEGELDYGPRRKYVENKAFRDIFPDSWRTAVLNDEPPCTPVGWRGFMLANGLVKYKAFRIVEVYDWVPEKFPPVPVGWKVDNRLLPPTCFEYESDSGDNFEAFAEQFSIADYGDFSHNTGKYFGDPIYPFKDNTAGDIWRYVGDCARDMDPDQLQISDSSVEYVYPSGRERLRYRILADISPNLCQGFAPNLPGKCFESYLVDVDYCGGSMGCRGPYAIYGMFQMQDGERIIFPLKNFDTENLARNFLDNN